MQGAPPQAVVSDDERKRMRLRKLANCGAISTRLLLHDSACFAGKFSQGVFGFAAATREKEAFEASKDTLDLDRMEQLQSINVARRQMRRQHIARALQVWPRHSAARS